MACLQNKEAIIHLILCLQFKETQIPQLKLSYTCAQVTS